MNWVGQIEETCRENLNHTAKAFGLQFEYPAQFFPLLLFTIFLFCFEVHEHRISTSSWSGF